MYFCMDYKQSISYMNDDLLKRVIEKSRELLTKYGVKSVTMDDISREIGISKKTLYTVIKDKHDLIEKTSFSISDDILSKIDDLLKEQLDPISELFVIEKIVCDNISSVDPSIIYQFQKFYPDIHNQLHSRQKKAIMEMIMNNLKRGIALGIYRADINKEFIANLDYHSSITLSNPDMFNPNEFEIREIKRDYLIYHLRGIASYKGLSFIESKLTDH